MRSFILCFILIVLLTIVFGLGVSQTLAGLMLIPFCALPFVLIGLGWSARGVFAGRRLALVTTEQRPAPTANRSGVSQRRQRLTSPEMAAEEHTL